MKGGHWHAKETTFRNQPPSIGRLCPQRGTVYQHSIDMKQNHDDATAQRKDPVRIQICHVQSDHLVEVIGSAVYLSVPLRSTGASLQ